MNETTENKMTDAPAGPAWAPTPGDRVVIRRGLCGEGYQFTVTDTGVSGHGEPIVYGEGYGPVRASEVHPIAEWPHDHALRIYTGPCIVRQVADKLRAAGVHVACEGTEHVYVTHEGAGFGGAADNVRAALQRTHGTDFGLRPRKV